MATPRKGKFVRWFCFGSATIAVCVACCTNLWNVYKLDVDIECSSFYDANARCRTLENARSVICSLRAWNREHGTYPQTLEEALGDSARWLAPEAGHPQWFYYPKSGGTQFALIFGVGEHPYPKMTYDSVSATWTCDN